MLQSSPVTREEFDLIGSRMVPVEAYWGIHTLRAMENFQISSQVVSSVPSFVRAMVMVKKACALANTELRVMHKDKCEAIVEACDQILEQGKCLDQFPIDLFQGGAGTSVNMNTNEVITNLALENLGWSKGRYDIIHPNDDLNRSQSTNDTYPTGLKLAFYALSQTLVEEIKASAQALHVKGDEFAGVVKMGRTQLQDAVPMTLGQEFHAFANTLENDISFIQTCASWLLEVNLGATAIGTGVNTPPGYRETVIKKLGEVTSLPISGAKDLVEATSDNSGYVQMHAALNRLAVKLSKMCNDLRLLSSGPRAGFEEINLPQMQAGSSIMPAKVNPVIPEVVNQICFKVIGNDLTVTMAAEAGQLQLNVMEPALAQAMFESFNLLTNALRTLREKCIVGISANEEKCRSYVEQSIGIITFFNDILGHGVGDHIGLEAARSSRSVASLLVEKGLVTQEQVNEVLSIDNLTKPRYAGSFVDVNEVSLPKADFTD